MTLPKTISQLLFLLSFCVLICVPHVSFAALGLRLGQTFAFRLSHVGGLPQPAQIQPGRSQFVLYLYLF